MTWRTTDHQPRRWPGHLLTACLLLGCRKESAVAPVPVSDAETLDRIRGLGGGAPFVVVVDASDERWPRVREYLVALRARARSTVPDTNLDDPVLGALRLLRIAAGVVELKDRDRGRPVVFALADPVVDGPPGLPSLLMRDPKAVRLRHVIDVPALDTQRLVVELDGALESAGRPWPALVAERPGARARELAGRGAIALLPEASTVRVVVITTAAGRDPTADLPAFVADLEPSPGKLAVTPALELAARSEFGASFHIRPWRMRALGASLGMGVTHEMLATIDADLRPRAFATGVNIVLDCERVLGEPREIDDWAVGLVADGPRSRTTVIGSLTERGRQIAGELVSEVRPLGLRRDDATISGFFGLAVVADEAAAANDLRSIPKKCGLLAPWSMGFGSPMAWGSAVARGVADEGLGTTIAAGLAARPRGLQFAVVPGLLAPGVAIAAIDPRVDQVEPLTAELERYGARTFVEEQQGRVVVLAGVGVDPREVFDTAVLGERSGVFQWRAAPHVFGEIQAAGRLDITGGLIVGETVGSALTLASTSPVAPRPVMRAQGEADHRALECLRRAEAQIVPALIGMNEINVRRTAAGPREWLATAGPDLECARGHRDTAEAGLALLRHARAETVATLIGIGESRAATTFVEDSCKQPDDECAVLAKLRALPQVALPDVVRTPACLEQTFATPYGVHVLIGGDRIAVAGEVIAADPAALTAALARVRPPAPRLFDVYLFVDQQVKLGTVIPVLEAVSSLGEDMVMVGTTSCAGFAATGLQLRRPGKPRPLPLGQPWQSFVEDIAVHCELAAIDF